MREGAVALLLVGLLGCAPGCRRSDGTEKAQLPVRSGVERAAPSRLDLTPGAVPGSRFDAEPRWVLASRGTEIDLLRLAQREGALGLLEGVEAGRTPALTALDALPAAEDAELALGRLCELLANMGSDPALPLLTAIHAVAAKPPRQREPLSVQGYARCLPVMQRLAKQPDLDPARHDLASSASQLLLEHRDAARH